MPITEVLPSELRPPPATRGRRQYYPDIPDNDWNDWHWQLRNRITSLEGLAGLVQIPPRSTTPGLRCWRTSAWASRPTTSP